ncbi:MAG: hypothetical protein HYX26_02835 [Acidobacteriales bacterium]|nr:hypothetical protein [Terriglobales bacterium]
MAEDHVISANNDLQAVHDFYFSLLQQRLGHPLPVPLEVARPDAAATAEGLIRFQHWLDLLDLAVSPAAIRDVLKQSCPEETLCALLRYYMRKQSREDVDRDKADFAATSLFRQMESVDLPGESHDHWQRIYRQMQECEQRIVDVLGLPVSPSLPAEHQQLLGEFEFLHQEAADFRTFDQLIDSGIIKRVRDIKQSFSGSFYHPKVLAAVAVYNVTFGRKFDQLFKATTDQIKGFAERMQTEGASIMSRVEGDITVKHLADVQEHKVMSTEYGQAQEHFKQISTFKKAVDKKGGGRRPTPAPAPAESAVPARATQVPASMAGDESSSPSGVQSSHAFLTRNAQSGIEEGRLRSQIEAIRDFVRVSERSTPTVPLTRGVINLSPSEIEAFKADYSAEKSFRADYAEILCYLGGVVARITVESVEYKLKAKSEYLWKPHADALTCLFQFAETAFARAENLLEVAKQRGLTEKGNALRASVVRCRQTIQESAMLLKTAGSGMS